MDLYSVRQKLSMGIPITKINLRVTYYSRVSTDREEQKNSLKNQIEYFDNLIKSNPYWTYLPGYIDDGISGTSDIKRDNFMKMINDAKENKFDLIITKEISRFSRNTLDSIKYTRELLEYGVAVLFVNDNINTSLPDSELRLTIMASIAQDEIRRLSERVKFGMNRAIQNGHILGNNTLYGYQKDNKTGCLKIVEEESLVIKEIYRMYAISNLSLSKIKNYLDSNNIKTRQNKTWCITTLKRLISNPKYKGYYCGKKTEVIDYMTKKVKIIPNENRVIYKDSKKIPSIVPENLWNKANDKLNKRNLKFGEDYKKDKLMYLNRYPLSAKLYCSIDNALFHRRKTLKSSLDPIWTCSTYLKEGKNSCNSPHLRQNEIYYILEDIINKLSINTNHVTNILYDLYTSNNKNINFDKDINKYNQTKEKITLKKEKLLDLYLSNNLSNEEFSLHNNKYNNELQLIENKINKLEEQKNNYNDFLNNNEKIKDYITKELNSLYIKEKLISCLLNKIIVTKIDDNNIKLDIYLNVSKEYITKETNLSIKTTNKILEDIYEFKRGYNTIGTKRYTINYQVNSYILSV